MRLESFKNASSVRSSERVKPLRFASASSMDLPVLMFSSFISRLKNCLIFTLVEEPFTIFSQSQEGPFEFWEVITSTTSPTCSGVLSGTIFPFTFAPTQRFPTAE